MKLPKSKKKDIQGKLSEIADKLGAEYTQAAEAAKANEADKAAANQEIKTIAARYGTKKGNNHTITGKKYIVGYVEIPTFSVDEKLGAAKVAPKIWEQCFKRVFDPEKFNNFIESGVINRKTASKIVKKGHTTQRVIVTPVRKGA